MIVNVMQKLKMKKEQELATLALKHTVPRDPVIGRDPHLFCSSGGRDESFEMRRGARKICDETRGKEDLP